MDKRVNPRQLEVLKWIVDGCPNGVMQDFTYKTVTYALRARGLASVSKKGGVWRATATDAGHYYLKNGCYPEPAQSTRIIPAIVRRRAAEAALTPLPKTERTKPTTPPEVAPTAPTLPAREEVPLPRVDVPDQLRRPHPAVVALRDDKIRFSTTGVARNRALRILQGLITAAERQGFTAQEVHFTRSGYGYKTWDSKHHLLIDTGELSIGARVFQEPDRSPHEPTARELADQKSWGRHVPKYDHSPSDRLRIEIDSRWGGQRQAWRDGKREPLEAQLGEILHEFALRHEYAVARRIKDEAEQVEHQRRWQVCVDRAKVELREHHRAEVLMAQAKSWQQANELREYLKEMEAAVAAELDPDRRAAGREWFEWAMGHAESLNPLNSPIEMPQDPDPTDEALAPFLPRRSLYGYSGW